jgi:hypothetical protein
MRIRLAGLRAALELGGERHPASHAARAAHGDEDACSASCEDGWASWRICSASCEDGSVSSIILRVSSLFLRNELLDGLRLSAPKDFHVRLLRCAIVPRTLNEVSKVGHVLFDSRLPKIRTVLEHA